jgi:hypothetical protein
MKKIPNLFERDWNGDKSRVLPELHAGADVEWVLRGEGVPTVKWDGSAVLVRGGKLFVRFDAKKNRKAKPPGFEPCQEIDPVTGHQPGWIPSLESVSVDDWVPTLSHPGQFLRPGEIIRPAARWHFDAFANSGGPTLEDGTYEAVGPQLQSNPYRFPRNILIRHGADPLPTFGHLGSAVSAFDVLRRFLEGSGFRHPEMPEQLTLEGIVWHHPDGRMVKVLASDLGLAWKRKAR